MIVEYVRYALAQHQPAELIDGYRAAAEHLDAAPECISDELTQCADDPRSLVLRIEWQSAEAQLRGFRRGPSFPPYFAAIQPFVGEIAEMRHYERTDVVSG